MKVIHVVTAFPRHDEDVITPWLGQVLLRLRASNVDARVLAPSYRGGGATEWRGVPVTRFRYAPAAWETLTHDETAPDRLRHRPWYAGLLPGYVLGGLAASIRAGLDRPDVIHVHWPVPHALFGAVGRAASDGSAAVVSSFYSVELKWIEHRLPLLVPFLRWSIESADVVTAISTATASAVGQYTRQRVRVIPFAAGLPLEANVPVHGEAASTSGEDLPEILFVGRLVERKGLGVLVRALARMREQRPVRLTIVGAGSAEGSIRATVRAANMGDLVRFTGPISDEELARRYASADLFVLPAVVDAKGDTEGLGVVLLEALRSGLPVIGSAAGGIPDIIRDGETGWLVTPGDVVDLARAIEEALDDPSEAARRAARGLERVDARFSLDGVVASVIESYEAAIEHRRRR